MKEELDAIDLRDLESLVGSYARLTGSIVGFSLEKNDDVMLKHDEVRGEILGAIMKLFGQGGEGEKRRITYKYATPEEIVDPNILTYDLEGTKNKAIRRVEVVCGFGSPPDPHLNHATTEELFEEIGTRIGTKEDGGKK